MSLLCAGNKVVCLAQVTEPSAGLLVCVVSSSVKWAWSPVAGMHSKPIMLNQSASQRGPQPCITRAVGPQSNVEVCVRDQ